MTSSSPNRILSQCAKVLLKTAAILLGGILLGWVLLMAAYALPLAPIHQHLTESLTVFDNNGGTAEDMSEKAVKGYMNTWQDNRTDVMMMLFAVHASEEPLYRQAALSMSYEHETNGMMDCLREYLANGSGILKEITYGRYWHGYLVFLKPMLEFFNYMDIRMVNMLLSGAMLAALCWLMQKRGLGRYLPALCAGLMLLTPWVIPLNMQYMTSFYPMAAAMLMILWKPDFIRTRIGDWAFFLIIGMITAYVDVLTYPLVTFGMPFVVWTLCMDEGNPRAYMTALIRLGLMWAIGYLGMWAGKWALVAIFGTPAEVAEIFFSIDARTSAEEVSRISAVMRNLLVFWRKPYKLAALCMSAGLIIAWFRARGQRKPMSLWLALCWVLTALLPLCWYYVMANHSHTHYFYTHRALAVTAFAGLCFLTRLTARKEAQPPTVTGRA